MPATKKPSRWMLATAAMALFTPVLAACGSNDAPSSGQGRAAGESSGSATPQASAVKIRSNVAPGATGVKVDTLIRVAASDGDFKTIAVRSGKGVPVPGKLNADRTRWIASSRLEPGRQYVVNAVGADSKGLTKSYQARFTTQHLTLKQQTFPSVSPIAGRTVGVGMPILIHFDVPVTDRANIERHMKVTSSAGQTGGFYWVDDQNVRYRPKTYWKANSKITVDLDLNSVSAGNGIYGQKSRTVVFNVGDAMISKVNIRTDQMKVFRNGKLLRTIPVTTGEQPKFTTRSGIKVIVEQFRRKRMNSETIGIDPNSADGYDLDDVEYAQRVTNTGEFIHAAPWSVASQGRANVSHGCTGMSTANAGWLYANSKPGDVVDYTGTSKPMDLTNGYGDWNLSWAQWQKGSAL